MCQAIADAAENVESLHLNRCRHIGNCVNCLHHHHHHHTYANSSIHSTRAGRNSTDDDASTATTGTLAPAMGPRTLKIAQVDGLLLPEEEEREGTPSSMPFATGLVNCQCIETLILNNIIMKKNIPTLERRGLDLIFDAVANDRSIRVLKIGIAPDYRAGFRAADDSDDANDPLLKQYTAKIVQMVRNMMISVRRIFKHCISLQTFHSYL